LLLASAIEKKKGARQQTLRNTKSHPQPSSIILARRDSRSAGAGEKRLKKEGKAGACILQGTAISHVGGGGRGKKSEPRSTSVLFYPQLLRQEGEKKGRGKFLIMGRNRAPDAYSLRKKAEKRETTRPKSRETGKNKKRRKDFRERDQPSYYSLNLSSGRGRKKRGKRHQESRGNIGEGKEKRGGTSASSLVSPLRGEEEEEREYGKNITTASGSGREGLYGQEKGEEERGHRP